jgi:predicted metal-dependent hydrolase
MKLQKLYLERLAEKLNNLTIAEKERIEGVNEIAVQLLKRYGLEHIKFEFGHNRKYYGICHQDRIELDLFLALNAPREVVRNIILHEIAHALVYPLRGHGEKWQTKAKELGVTWERKYRK